MRSTNSGMPRIVVPTSASSSCAGTITATRLPSSTASGASARDERLPGERGEQAEQEAEERGDHDVIPTAPRGRPHRGRVRQNARLLDLLRLQQLLLRGELVLEDLAEEDDERRVAAGRTPNRADLLLVGCDALLQQRDLLRRVPREPLRHLTRQRVPRDARLPRGRSLHSDPHERALLEARRADTRGPAGYRLRRDLAAQLPRLHRRRRARRVDRLLRAGDRADARRVRLLRLQRRVAGIAVRLPEVHRRARLPDLRAAERDQIADDRAGDEAGDRQPPSGRDRARISAEVDLLLGIELRFARTRRHRAATLFAAHSHCACNPRLSGVVARHPRSRSIRVVSGAVRRTSPFAAGRSTSSRVRPETASRVSIASRIVASAPPPRLYVAPAGARSIAAAIASTPSATYVNARDCRPSPYNSKPVPRATASTSRANAMSGRCRGP